MLALIDFDIVTFRCAFSAEDEPEGWVACSRADKLIRDICIETESNAYQGYLSGKGNFRYTVYPEYKANRIKANRPKWEKEVKDYLTRNHHAIWSEGCEADDLLGIEQSKSFNTTVICTTDKDLLQIPGWHYNFVKKEKQYVDTLQGIRFFYYQLLVGDSADGIKGCEGIGPKKAERLLSKGETEEDWFNLVRAAYDNDIEMEMNASVLKIWTKPNEEWSIENKTKQFQENATTK